MLHFTFSGRTIGSQIEGTFVNKDGRLVLQGTINGRPGAVAENSYLPAAGDWCSVRIVGLSGDETHYLLDVEGISRKGKSKVSPLQIALLAFQGYYHAGAVELHKQFILGLRTRLSDCPRYYLETLLEILEHYSMAEEVERPGLDYNFIGDEIMATANKIHGTDEISRLDCFVRAFRYCDANADAKPFARSMLDRALQRY